MEGYIGEVRMCAGSYVPRNWAACQGQLLSINNYQALYSLLGTVYGGDGKTTFGVPDLRGRLPVQPGQPVVPGSIPSVVRGHTGGNSQAMLAVPLPQHTHTATFAGTSGGGGGGGGGTNPNGTLDVEVTIAVANTNTSNATNPQDNIIAVPKFSGLGSINAFTAPANATADAYLGGVTAKLTGEVAPGGGGGGITGGTVTVAATGIPGAAINVPTVPPYLGINFIICVNGIYPSRN